MTQCGNIVKRFRINTSAINVDCTDDTCALTVCQCQTNISNIFKCIDEKMKPTLDTIKCKVFGKKKKLQPKKAKVKCVVKSGEQGKHGLSLESAFQNKAFFFEIEEIPIFEILETLIPIFLQVKKIRGLTFFIDHEKPAALLF